MEDIYVSTSPNNQGLILKIAIIPIVIIPTVKLFREDFPNINITEHEYELIKYAGESIKTF